MGGSHASLKIWCREDVTRGTRTRFPVLKPFSPTLKHARYFRKLKSGRNWALGWCRPSVCALPPPQMGRGCGRSVDVKACTSTVSFGEFGCWVPVQRLKFLVLLVLGSGCVRRDPGVGQIRLPEVACLGCEGTAMRRMWCKGLCCCNLRRRGLCRRLLGCRGALSPSGRLRRGSVAVC